MPESERVHTTDFLRRKGGVMDARITQYKLDPRSCYELFNVPLVAGKAAGAGAATGSTGDTNVLRLGRNSYEYHVKGTQTIVAPVMTTVGLDIGMDQTAADGIEITGGILADNRRWNCFKVGTDEAFFTRLVVKVEDASGCNPLLLGMRKAEAYQAAHTGYADHAWLGLVGTANPNTIQTITELAGAGHTTTDTGATAADASTKTLEVRVSGGGVTTFWVNGAQVLPTLAHTFAAGAFIIPAIYFLEAADLAGKVELISWEWGLQSAHD